jgi:cobalt-zinc-cadmium efflux system outer membrane protein
VWLAAAEVAPAQDSGVGLTVRDALVYAEAHSPELGRLRAQLEARRADRRASIGLEAPTLAFGREGIPTSGDAFTEQRWVVEQALDLPMATYWRRQRLGAEIEVLALRLEAARQTLRGRVKTAYAEVLYAQEMVHLGAQGVMLGESLLAAVMEQVAAGAAAELDALKVELQLADARGALEERLRLHNEARYTLYHAIGLDPDAQAYGVVFPDTLVYRETAVGQEEVLSRLAGLPEIAGADRAALAASWRVREMRNVALPRLRLSYWPQDFGGGYRFRAFEVGVSVPLWFAFSERGAVLRARAEAEETRWSGVELRLDIKRDIERAWHGYQSSKQTIQRYATTVRALAEDVLARTREGYRLGQLDLLSLLDTQRTYLSAQVRYYEALRTYYVHLIQLERYLGRDLVFAE